MSKRTSKKRAKVRRAKLYFIREKVAREIKRQMRRMSLVHISSESEAETAQRQAEAERNNVRVVKMTRQEYDVPKLNGEAGAEAASSADVAANEAAKASN